MFRNRTSALLMLIVLGSIASTTVGQTEDVARLLAPCVAEDTLAVVRIDVGRIDVDAICKMATDTASNTMDASQIQQIKDIVQRLGQTWKQRLAQFTAAGGERLYLVCNLGDMLLVVPVTTRLNESAMKSWMDGLGGGPLAYARKDGLLIATPQWAMEGRKAQSAMRRAALSQATAKSTTAAVEVFLIPSVDSRRVLEAMLPGMLGPDFELKRGALVDGLQWATIGIDPPPDPSLTVYVESADTVAASALKDFIVQGLTVMTQLAVLDVSSANIQASVALLRPQVSGNTLTLTVDGKQFERLTSGVLTPSLFAVRESILCEQCAANLSGMGRAFLIYANDHEDKWPPSLETLVEMAEYPRSGLFCPAMRHKPDYESYVYRGVDTGGTSVEPMIIMVHDRAGNHEGGRNVLFVDSHVEWATEQQFAELVKQDNEMRRGRGLAEKPAQ